MMRFISVGSLVLVGLFLSRASGAQDPSESLPLPGPRVELGARVGVGVPLGSVYRDQETGKSVSMSELYTGMAPLWLDVGYRIPSLYVGLYAQYAFVAIRDCEPDRRC